METYIGMDFGGTKLLIGEVNRRGEILGLKSYSTGYVNQESAVELIKQSLADYLTTVGTDGRQPVAVGIGMIGRVDTAAGKWLQIDSNRNSSIDLADEISKAFGIDCFISNDVKSALLPESVLTAALACSLLPILIPLSLYLQMAKRWMYALFTTSNVEWLPDSSTAAASISRYKSVTCSGRYWCNCTI